MGDFMKRCIAVLVYVALAVSLHGQATFSILAPGITLLPAYANANTTTQFSYTLQYNGTTPFTGNLYTYVDVNGITQLPALDTITVTGLNPGDTYTDTVQDFRLSANPGPFVNGRNGIVIWVADDNFNAISDSSGVEILVACGPAFRLFNSTNGIPNSGLMGLTHDFDIEVENIHEICYKDTLYLNVRANNVGLLKVATTDMVQLPFATPTSVHIQQFPFTPDVFVAGWNDVRMWVSGRDGCFAADSLSLQLYVATATSTPGPHPGDLQVLAWPNPTAHHLFLRGDVPAHTQLMLTDVLGHRTPLGEWREDLDLPSLHIPHGHYILTVLTPRKQVLHIPLAYLP